jgi:hypothetical protein
MHTVSAEYTPTIAPQNHWFVFMGSGFAAAQRPGMTIV